MDPLTFELQVKPDGSVSPGSGVLAAFVPAQDKLGAVVVFGCDPRHEPDRSINELAPSIIAWLANQIGDGVSGACWTIIDNHGQFVEAVPEWQKIGPFNTKDAPLVEFLPFPQGSSIDGFFQDTGAAGEVAIELLSGILEKPGQEEASPSVNEFLDAVESCGTLPAPSIIFKQVTSAAENGDARQVAHAVQPDPVISAALIHAANAARFANMGKTASVPQAVTRLGTSFVRRVVFVADMMSRYKKGACASFDYHGYWLNALATGAAMRALLEDFDIPARMADDAFTTGLVSSIGWLAVAETFPLLMTKYLEICGNADPITKARHQRKIFPCEITRVSERYLQRFEFPEVIYAAVAGRTNVDRQWYDCLARAIRVGQALAPFSCLAIPTTIPVPESCREEWQRWQGFLGGYIESAKPDKKFPDLKLLDEPDQAKGRYMDWR